MNTIPSFITDSPNYITGIKEYGAYRTDTHPQIFEYLKERYPHFSWSNEDHDKYILKTETLLHAGIGKILQPNHIKVWYGGYSYKANYDPNIILPNKVREREIAIIEELCNTLDEIDKMRDNTIPLFINYGGIFFTVTMDPKTYNYHPSARVCITAYEGDPTQMLDFYIRESLSPEAYQEYLKEVN